MKLRDAWVLQSTISRRVAVRRLSPVPLTPRGTAIDHADLKTLNVLVSFSQTLGNRTVTSFVRHCPLWYFPLVALFAAMIGCLQLSDATPINLHGPYIGNKNTPPPDRALVIVGLGVEGWLPDHQSAFAATLYEYSLDRHAVMGNCWRNNRMEARVPAIVGTHEYFVFDVKPGAYVYAGITGTTMKHLAFEVPAGQIVYVGDFVWTTFDSPKVYGEYPQMREGVVEHRNRLEAVKSYFQGKVVLADPQLVPQASPVICFAPL